MPSRIGNSDFRWARRRRRRGTTALIRARVRTTSGSRAIGIRAATAGSGMTATGRVHRTPAPTGYSRTGKAAGSTKATGERPAGISATTIAGIVTTIAATGTVIGATA